MSDTTIFRKDLFEGRVYLVTGGGSGLGRAISTELSTLGAKVFITGRNEQKLKDCADFLNKNGGNAHYYPCDIRDEPSVKELVGEVIAKFNQIDGLINNAGGQFPCPSEHISLGGWNAVINNNLTGTFLVSKEVVNQYFAKFGGCIVNMLAENRNGMPMMAHSGAARAGVENLTKTTSIEWAKYGVRVNSISPGVIRTSGLDSYPEEFKEVLKTLPPKIPLKRLGTSSEISSSVL